MTGPPIGVHEGTKNLERELRYTRGDVEAEDSFVADPVGVRIDSLPITPEKVLAALREQGSTPGNKKEQAA